MGAAFNILFNVFNLFATRVTAFEPNFKEGGVALDPHKDVIEIVGDTARQRADCFHFLRRLQLDLKFFSFLFGPPPLGHVAHHPPESYRPVHAVLHERKRKLQVPAGAVLLADHVIRNRGRLTGLLNLIQNALHRRGGFRCGEVLSGHPSEFVGVVPENAAQRPVEKSYFTQQVGFKVSLFDAFQDAAVFRFA